MKKIITLMSIVGVATGIASAQNLLVNGDFNDPASIAAPTGWSTWNTDTGGQGAYENHELLTSTLGGNAGIYDGTYQMTLGNYITGSTWEGVYQVVAGTAGLTYNLSVDAGAQAWWWPNGYINLDFLDASNTQLGQAQIITTASITGYDIGVVYQNFSESAVAPVGTTQVKVELEEYGGGSAWFDNAVLTVVPEPSTLAMLAVGSLGLLGWRRIFRRR
jgi:hypothetical protein